tara:strand:- start:825 stop:7754 length:6930 start_codon:yes stop_codon:yes gene_type:complete
MASSLSNKDKNLLKTGQSFRIGNKPYENGVFGEKQKRDFIHFELASVDGSSIESRILPFSRINIDDEGKLLIRPVRDLKISGINTGQYRVNYRFLRRLAGDEEQNILVKTQPSDNGKFDVYSDLENIEITPGGKIFEQNNGERGNELQLKSLGLQVDAISTNRREVRLRTQDINVEGYSEDFFRLGESIRRTQVPAMTISFGTENEIGQLNTESNVLSLVPEIVNTGGPPPGFNAGSGPPGSLPGAPGANGFNQDVPVYNFLFTQRMIGGTIYIPDVFLVKTITTTPKTETNIVKNAGGELLVKDAYGQAEELGTKYPWDENLHSFAVQAEDWSSGYLSYLENSDVWRNCVHLGYWAYWVKGEGKNNSNCMKFPDLNESFAQEFTEWPLENPHRPLLISQTYQRPLQSLGIGHQDNAVITFDVKTSIPNKPVRVSLRYPNFLDSEPQPTTPPEGFYNPNSPPGSNEDQPLEPPTGYAPSTVAGASNIEPKPAARFSDYLEFIQSANQPPIPPQVGMNTSVFGGLGVWKISATEQGQNPLVTWVVDTSYTGFNDMVGEMSEGGEWRWDGTQWNTHPEPTIPTPLHKTVNGREYRTVNPIDFPTAVNRHSYAPQGESILTRRPIFERNTPSGTGFEYGCVASKGEVKTLAGQSTNFSESTDYRGWALFGKQDQIWFVKKDINSINSTNYYYYEWDELFPQLRTTVVIREDTDGNTTEVSLYEDIFQFGRVQSICKARHENGQFQPGSYHIFYNDGMGRDDSNKSFRIDRYVPGSDELYPAIDGVFKIADLDAPMNQAINDNGGRVKWAGYRKGSTIRFYAFVNNLYYRVDDGDGDLYELDDNGQWIEGDGYYPATIDDDGFENMPINPDIVMEEDPSSSSGDYSGWVTIVGTEYYDQLGGDKHNLQSTLNEKFFGVGEFFTGGVDFIFGTRNPGTENWLLDADGNDLLRVPDFDDGSGIPIVGETPDKVGTLSPLEFWIWSPPDDTNTNYYWKFTGPIPPRYQFVRPGGVNAPIHRTQQANVWERVEVKIPIGDDWRLDAPGWSLVFEGHDMTETNTFGISWIDNVDLRFELVNETTETPVKKPFSAQITSVSDDGRYIEIDKTFNQAALAVSEDDNPADAYFAGGADAGSFTGFDVSYTVFNPRELRTYLKFGNRFFLTTNFKRDIGSVTNYPNAITFKLYNPLPPDIARFSELSVVKEMVTPVSEKVKIVDFVDNELGDRLLKSPDLTNVESPVQRRTSQFRNEADIVTADPIVSEEIKNKVVSQSLDSAELNIDHSQFSNFVNFSSVEQRLKNFKYKLQLIESYTKSSSSLANVSGSSDDKNVWLNRINKVKNNFDHFENYMYFQSSSYVSNSLGIKYDNAWPKVSGTGTLISPYVLAHTTSSEATTWYNTQVVSASNFDVDNLNTLSTMLPEHIQEEPNNEPFIKFTNMIAHHFDNIWVYIKGMGDITDRRDRLDEGISKDLLYSVAKSLGWHLNDSSDMVSLPRYHSGNEVTGSNISTFSAIPQKDITRELWSRIINNMPYFLKHKGTVNALKGLINVYGIPSTILRVKEYGGPKISDDDAPQFEITRKFTKALDFRAAQYVKLPWTNDAVSGRKPDTIEFRFRSVSSSNQILVEKESTGASNRRFFIRLKDNDTADNYGHVALQVSGSGGMREIQTGELPVYDGEFHSVMVRRTLRTDSHANLSQSFQLAVGKYDASRSKLNLYSAVTMSLTSTSAVSQSFVRAWTEPGTIYIGGSGSARPAGTEGANISSVVGTSLTGSMMEYRHWTETLNVKSFKNHIANPQAYDGNSITSSYGNLVTRYSFNDNKDLSTDTAGIRDVSSNQTTTISGSHNGFNGNFFSNVTDELQSHIPSIGALRRTTKKIRIEGNSIQEGKILDRTKRATVSAYDTAPNDSNKVGIFFAPTDVINNDIISSVGDLNFENFLGDPRDKDETSYRGLKDISDSYWQKYTEPNNFWDYIRMLKYFDQSLYPQLRKMVPARAKADIGLLVEPNIFERPKVVYAKKPRAEQRNFRGTIDLTGDYVAITGSYNAGVATSNFDAYTDTISISNINESGSQIVITGSYDTYEGTIDELKARNFALSIWQTRGQPGFYLTSSITAGDLFPKQVHMPIISGSRVFGRNQKRQRFFASASQALNGTFSSESFKDIDLDVVAEQSLGLFNSFYAGSKNTLKTTADGGSPIEITITSPTKLVTDKEGESSLKTGDGKISNFKFKGKKKKSKFGFSKNKVKADGTLDDAALDIPTPTLGSAFANFAAGFGAGDDPFDKGFKLGFGKFKKKKLKKKKKKKKGGKKSFKFSFFGGKK